MLPNRRRPSATATTSVAGLIEDLLGREPVKPDTELLGGCTRAKSVLVTGAGGSIGSELCRQIIRLGPVRLVLMDQSEIALYEIENELRSSAKSHAIDIEIVALLGDVEGARLHRTCKLPAATL